MAGILALSTYSPTIDTLSAESNSANTEIPIFMAHGDYDPVIPVSAGTGTCDQLISLGYNVQWQSYPMQHEVCMEEIAAIRTWLLARLQ